jgi:Fe-S cluster biosynthesis and repair protein YggX
MSKTVFCLKLNKQAPALLSPPFPNDLGDRIFHNISQPAWDGWVIEQTKLINELRLDISDEKSQDFLQNKMLEYLFSEKSVDVEKD